MTKSAQARWFSSTRICRRTYSRRDWNNVWWNSSKEAGDQGGEAGGAEAGGAEAGEEERLDRGRVAARARVAVHEPRAARVLPRASARDAKGIVGEGGSHLGASAGARAPGRSDRPGHDRGRVRVGASRARPREKASQENRRGPASHRRGQLRLLRGDRRADRHPSPDRAADGNAFHRGAIAPRAEAEALRGVTDRLPHKLGRPVLLPDRG